MNILVVLEVKTNTWQVDKRLDASLAKLLRVTDTRALENEWRAQRSARHDDLLACSDDTRWRFTAGQVLGGNNLDANGAVAFEDDLGDMSGRSQMYCTGHISPSPPCCLSRGASSGAPNVYYGCIHAQSQIVGQCPC
jgi:hypothetical protein